MENKLFSLPTSFTKYINRKTGEEVEVIDFESKERGDRSDEDWVTYIDSNGNEHLKEHLNFMLDFKPNDNTKNMFDKIFNDHWKKNIPSTYNTRLYEVTKELVINRFMAPDEAYDKAKRIVDLCKE